MFYGYTTTLVFHCWQNILAESTYIFAYKYTSLLHSDIAEKNIFCTHKTYLPVLDNAAATLKRGNENIREYNTLTIFLQEKI